MVPVYQLFYPLSGNVLQIYVFFMKKATGWLKTCGLADIEIINQ